MTANRARYRKLRSQTRAIIPAEAGAHTSEAAAETMSIKRFHPTFFVFKCTLLKHSCEKLI